MKKSKAILITRHLLVAKKQRESRRKERKNQESEKVQTYFTGISLELMEKHNCMLSCVHLISLFKEK